MSTLAGHSDLHALQDRHRSSDRLTCSSFQPPPHHLALQQLEQHVRAAARAVLFLERHHVARAHRAGIVLAAFAQADAPQHRPLERSLVVRKREVRGRPLRRVVGAEPEVLGRQIGVDDLARVHLAVGIPDRLELAERAASARRRTSSAAARRAIARRRARPTATRRTTTTRSAARSTNSPYLRMPCSVSRSNRPACECSRGRSARRRPVW